MNKNFNKFLDIISQQTALYAELKQIAKEKQDIIVKNDISALEAITKKEQGFVKTIMSLENMRVKAIDNYCNEEGIGNVQTITELVDNFDELEKRQFNIMRDKLITVLNDLQELNELNSALLNQSLDYVNLSINVINSFGFEDAGYDNKAADRDIKIDKSLFDAKV